VYASDEKFTFGILKGWRKTPRISIHIPPNRKGNSPSKLPKKVGDMFENP